MALCSQRRLVCPQTESKLDKVIEGDFAKWELLMQRKRLTPNEALIGRHSHLGGLFSMAGAVSDGVAGW